MLERGCTQCYDKFCSSVHRGVLCEGARHHFDKKGVITAARGETTAERALELAIESGAEDVHEAADDDEKPVLQVKC